MEAIHSVFIISLVVLLCSLVTLFYLESYHMDLPASVPKMIEWGTFRPNLYFGARAAIPYSPLFGVMWYNPDDPEALTRIRYDAEEFDGLSRYGWNVHDGRRFGMQELLDAQIGVNFTTSFMREPQSGDWRAVITGSHYHTKPANPPRNVSLIWALSLQNEKHSMKISNLTPSPSSSSTSTPNTAASSSSSSSSSSSGSSARLGDDVEVTVDTHETSFPSFQLSSHLLSAKGRLATHYMGVDHELEDSWNVKPLAEAALIEHYRRVARARLRALEKKQAQQGRPEDTQALSRRARNRKVSSVGRIISRLPDSHGEKATVVLVQYVLTVPFTIEFRMNQPTGIEAIDQHRVAPSDSAEERAMELKEAFEHRFEKTFRLAEKGYDDDQQFFARSAFSNLIGGLGYFHGTSIHQRPTQPKPVLKGPDALFCTVPSRSFFPRGFLWDEGFHQLLVQRWEPKITLRVISSWFALIEPDGWLPREQILGKEARRRVPEQFQVQRPHIANPPTLFLALQQLLSLHSTPPASPLPPTSPLSASQLTDIELARFLWWAFPLLEKHVNYYHKTQASAYKSGSFHWAEHTLRHCFSSGLDDYPRAPWLTDHEGHVDMQSWMVFLSRTVSNLANWMVAFDARERKAGKAVPWEAADRARIEQWGKEHRVKSRKFLSILHELHWNATDGAYYDYAVYNGTVRHIKHIGYVNLFPFLLQLLPPNSAQVGATLKLLSDPNGIWSDFGLRSLSKQDRLFGSEEDYWRGHIWMNINYLAVSSLHHYSKAGGPHASRAGELYNQLRKHLVDNLFHNYQDTGYLWEQYNALTGKGQRSHPFTGWSALVVLMMSEQYTDLQHVIQP